MTTIKPFPSLRYRSPRYSRVFHPEDQIQAFQSDALLWDHLCDKLLADDKRKGIYKWIGIAQESNEQHF